MHKWIGFPHVSGTDVIETYIWHLTPEPGGKIMAFVVIYNARLQLVRVVCLGSDRNAVQVLACMFQVL